MEGENTKVYDLAIIGCGPAGLSAAVNAAIRRKDLIILGSEFCSPKLHKAPHIDNYLGLPGVGGEELRQAALKHVARFGLKVHPARVETIIPLGDRFQFLTRNSLYEAKAAVLATGVVEVATLPGEEDFLGRGVSYCATCDGPLFRGQPVAVVADIPEGEEEANYLAEIASTVYYLPLYKRNYKLNPKVTVLPLRPRAIHGLTGVESVELADGTVLHVQGLFIIREATNPNRLVPGLELAGTAVRVDREQRTNIPGLFAAGDCTGRPYQLAKAVGEGQVAALSAVRYLDQKR
ncbi:MAG TPA: NAD(P)/FAD-dependent oxidoreductase [Firmicutes bacterium]|nr:NAD(P)/FAD-dependent oxidoreductase [Bacillota bacterium]